VTKPSFLIRPGDVLTLRNRENLKNVYRSILTDHPPDTLDWVTLDSENLQATVQGTPTASDISLPVDVNVVIEFLSR